MQEGESELGGLKIPHGNTTPSSSTPDSQSVDSIVPNLSQSALVSQPTPPPQPAPVPQPSIPRPTMQPVLDPRPTTPQPPVTSTPPIPRLTSQAFDQPQPVPTSPVQPSFQPQPPLQSQFPTQPISSGTDDIILPSSDPAPRQPRKGLIIAIVLVVLALVVAVITLVVVNHNSGGTLFGGNSQQEKQLTKEEVYDLLWDFNTDHYSYVIKQYEDAIGLIPNFAPSASTLFFPLAEWVPYFTQELEETVKAYGEIAPNIPDYLQGSNINILPTKNSISESLAAMEYNMDLLNQFYQTYYLPFTNAPQPTTCAKSQEMLDLEQDSNTASAANSYYSLYCTTVEFLNSNGDNEDIATLQSAIFEPTATAAASLNNLLIEVSSANNQIDGLFEELTK